MSLTEFDDSPRIPVCIVCSTRFAFRSPLCIACEAEARDKMREFLANSKFANDHAKHATVGAGGELSAKGYRPASFEHVFAS